MRWLLLLFAMLPATLHAQAPVASSQLDAHAVRLQTQNRTSASNGRLVIGGLAGGAVGFFALGYIGALIADDASDDEFAALGGFATGAVIGETIGLPLGVHLANGRQGKLLPSVLTSSGISALALFAATRGEDHLEYLLVVPLVQLVTSIAIERRTSR